MAPAARRIAPFVRTAILLLAAALASPPAAGARFDPAWRWSALESDHFVVSYHDGFRGTALRAAAIAEEVHTRLSAEIGWTPTGRTHLVLADATDYGNGLSTPFPYNRIVVYLAAPLELPGFGLSAGDEWLRLVITHEYAHTLQMDMASGLPGALRWILGRLYFPNAHQPIWLIEGPATYRETELTAGGRGRSSYESMVLRAATLAGKVPPLSRMAVFPERWPAGETPYLFGESFVRFLGDRYGPARVAELSQAYAGRTIPFLVDTTARGVLGRGYGELWKEWKAELERRFRDEAAEVRRRGVTASAPLTARGHLTLGPAWSPDGSRIAFVSATPDEEAGLFVMNADGTGLRRLADAPFAAGASGTSPAWDPSGRLVFYSRLEIANTASVYSDLYCCDPATGREHRLTRGLRARDPHPSPDGRSLLFVAGGPGEGSVIHRVGLDAAGTALDGTPVPLTPAGDGLRWALPRYSPDGTMIAASAVTADGAASIRILDRTGRALRTVALDGTLCGSPAWTRDGGGVLFSADAGGIFDIFHADVATGAVSRVTRVVGGAFAPAPSPDGGTLAFVSYGAEGFDIHAMPLVPSAFTPEPAKDRRGPTPLPEPPIPAVRDIAASPASTLLPRFWYPVGGSDAANGTVLGIATFGQDALERHTYAATVLYAPRTGRVPFGLAYAYDGLTPTLTLGVTDLDRTSGGYFGRWVDADGENDYVERELSVQAVASLPLATIRRTHVLSAGARYRTLDAITDTASLVPAVGGTEPPRPEPPAEGTIVSSLLSYGYVGHRRPAAAISPEAGRALLLSWEHADDAFGGDLTFDRATIDWREYVSLPWWRHHVLALHLYGGTAGGDRLPQRAFRLGGDSVTDLLLGSDGETVALRGYPSGTLIGQNVLLVGAEYRFPILTIERGAATAPFYLRRLHASVFAEAGDAWDGGGEVRLRTGIGATVALDMTLFWALPVTLRLVAADGLDDGGEEQVYFTISAPLL